MIMSLPESHVNRIDLGIDWSKCTRKEIDFLELGSDLGDFQLNAQCNNRLARITELKWELAATEDPIRSDAIEDEIQAMLLQIEVAKQQGLFQDYGYLKRRIAEGASADEVYPMMPSAYAMVCDRVRRINARPVKHKKSFLALIGGATLLGVLADLITIRDSDLANRLKELLLEILRM
ncbi:MAG: hypothetical protein OXD31_04415 [Chloroflexi bacterium]|nr:hypothetical protein [Chloroflexota bacterium]